MIYIGPLLAVMVVMAIALARAILGPTVFDRLVAANMIGNSAILILALFGFYTDRPEFLDLGLVYALLNTVGTFAVLKYFRHGGLGYEDDE